MIALHCPNCRSPILPSMMVKDDCYSAIATCADKSCQAVYRITINVLHQGKPIDPAVRDRYMETYDNNGNRLTLRDYKTGQENQAKLREQNTQTADGTK